MIILIREFSTPDEEMKKIVLKAVCLCLGVLHSNGPSLPLEVADLHRHQKTLLRL